jgi:hypothetical protein
LYPAEAVTLLRVIKTAQPLGFTLEEVAELLEAGAHRHRRTDAGLQARASAKLAEVQAKIADLRTIEDTLRQAPTAGCADLLACAGERGCPLPFADLAGDPEAAFLGSGRVPISGREGDAARCSGQGCAC